MADDEKKPIPVNPGEKSAPISLSGTTLAKMIGSTVVPKQNAVQQIKMTAAAAGHADSRFMPGVKTGADADAALSGVSVYRPKQTTVSKLFARGETVYDNQRCKKATITKLNVAYTAKGRPLHKLVSKSGESWLQFESKLEKL